MMQSEFGYSDRHYPFSNVLVWLVGWLVLRLLLQPASLTVSFPFLGGADAGVPLQATALKERWLQSCLSVWTLCTCLFFLLQATLKLPVGFSYGRGSDGNTFSVPTSIFNDPHSLGSVAAALAVIHFSLGNRRQSWARVLHVLVGVTMLFLVAICYSRAAWAAAIVGMILLTALWRPWLTVALVGAFAIGLALVAFRADELLKLNHEYLNRLVYLVRLDRLPERHEARLEIFKRAPAMIKAHPFLGFGPGSTRVSSAAYLGGGDRWGADFMHNAVLQATVEQGLPAGLMLAALLFIPLGVAFYERKGLCKDAVGSGAFIAMLVFLLTEMTSNSLNIYFDQQLFFWEIAAILVFRCRGFGMRPESVD